MDDIRNAAETSSAEENLRYIEQHFTPEREVLAGTGIDAERLAELIAGELIPRACYFPEANGSLASNLGKTSIPFASAAFHPSAVRHIGDVTALISAGADPRQLAVERRTAFVAAYARHLESLDALGLVERDVWRAQFAEADSRAAVAQSEYPYWLDGTYGLCTRTNTAEAIAVKECMVANIDELTDEGRRTELSGEVKARLGRYIKLYDQVAALFAPFERAGSSRFRICTRLAQRYGLSGEPG